MMLKKLEVASTLVFAAIFTGSLVGAVESMKDANNPYVFIQRADSLRSSGQLDEAVAMYTKAMEIDASVADAYVGRGLALTAQEALGSAQQDFEQAIKLEYLKDPNSDRVRSILLANTSEPAKNAVAKLDMARNAAMDRARGHIRAPTERPTRAKPVSVGTKSKPTSTELHLRDSEPLALLMAEKVARLLAADNTVDALPFFTEGYRRKSLARIASQFRVQHTLTEATGGGVNSIVTKALTRDRSSSGVPLLRIEVVTTGVNDRRLFYVYDMAEMNDREWLVFDVTFRRAVPPL